MLNTPKPLRSEIVSTSYSNLTCEAYRDTGDQKSSYTFSFPNGKNDFTFIADYTAQQIHSKTGIIEVGSGSFENGMHQALNEILAGNVSATFSEFGLQTIASSMLQSGLNASANIPETMDRIAAAMTNRLRDTSSLNVRGQIGLMELFIRVS